ncbi:type IV pilus modification protein PilV [Shewanella schlegeliana]|uniref:Type IV pilus modification protein PilV n=1 Tax=Shewanella schlegeliana TaxID=190308 RepID=A0ABS1SUB9_9GAMM|nr:type IV pilus modification protein PilV [Shewanella schlegeliana]MBL4912131.1 type IV pilus modification protein PilV [Shewanella schlegeliana]MCL1110783.1 type IV pilus modification protein PilV [Shewanella schlegeliana]GIU22917.1 type IV pilus modification protein PilV [Shewanella schlegeliana]
MNTKEKGLSLIEVLVALVILTVGLVGVFNLHIISKRGSFESFQQTQAAYLANDIVSRIKLNRSQLMSYSGTYTGALSLPSKACDVAPGGAVICTTTETRIWDLYQWEQLILGSSETINGANVGGLDTATACIDAKASGEVTVVLSWRGMNKISEGVTHPSFVRSCGSSKNSERRRVYFIDTVII